jgi:hypothetical protein
VAGRTISIRIPAWTANLLPNVLGLAGLATICTMIAFLTDWRWGGLAGGICATALAWWTSQPVEAQPTAAVTSIKKAA